MFIKLATGSGWQCNSIPILVSLVAALSSCCCHALEYCCASVVFAFVSQLNVW